MSSSTETPTIAKPRDLKKDFDPSDPINIIETIEGIKDELLDVQVETRDQAIDLIISQTVLGRDMIQKIINSVLDEKAKPRTACQKFFVEAKYDEPDDSQLNDPDFAMGMILDAMICQSCGCVRCLHKACSACIMDEDEEMCVNCGLEDYEH